MTKECTECGQVKSLDGFAKEKHGKHGVKAKCKACVKVYKKSWDQSTEGQAYQKAHMKALRQRGKDFVNQYAKQTGQDRCVRCGSTDKLEWDHIDRTTKSFDIADCYTKKSETILEELKKCQRLCQPCHFAKGEHGRPITFRRN